MLRLPAYGAVELDAEPGEILADAVLEFGAAALAVDVLDAEEKRPAGLPRQRLVEERRIGVAEMEAAVRARREAQDGLRHAAARAMDLSHRIPALATE